MAPREPSPKLRTEPIALGRKEAGRWATHPGSWQFMATRHLYIARHGNADAFGELTDTGREQAQLLGKRLADLPIDTVWHSPLPRAVESAQEVAAHLRPETPVAEAAELVDHVPYVPTLEETPHAWAPFFDGLDPEEAAAGRRIAHSLTARFASPPEQTDDIHEVLITHSYPIAWLIRDALDAPPGQWLSFNSSSTALTVIEYRPGVPPGITLFNDMSHLPAELGWAGSPPSTWPRTAASPLAEKAEGVSDPGPE